MEIAADVLLRLVRLEKERQVSVPVEARGDQGDVSYRADQPSHPVD